MEYTAPALTVLGSVHELTLGDRHQNQHGKGHTSHGKGNGYGHHKDHDHGLS